jgi:hypothetical protein
MSRKIIGVTVGTTISPASLERKLKPVKTVNGIAADKNGNVEIAVKDGYTPQKGVDYYTETDKQEMVAAVLAALPTWQGGSY